MTPISFNSGLSSGIYSPELRNLRPQAPKENAKGIDGGEGLDPSLAQMPGVSNLNQAQVSFDNVLGKFVNEVNSKQMAAGDAVTGLLGGQNVPLHQAMIAMEEASVSFQLMVEVRNKLLEGYQELLRMQV